ncbi:sulfotransferase [Egicoccus sp. AB-alg2]|uniref:sulfotransferase n=1 Tax=Egicoccus sp. AB-alg2 TaxID=3242693 RepID=UPI00359D83FD
MPTTVLFIAGSGRSGTTLLQNVLGQLDGFFAAGELRYLWDRGAVKDRLCACGEHFHACPTWQCVLARAFGGLEPEHARRTAAAIETFRIAHLPRTWLPATRRRELRRLDGLLADLRRLYAAIVDVTGCRVIVDSSKNPAYGYLLAQAGVGELAVLHVVRDARAAAFSWGQRKEFEPGHLMRRRSAATAAVEWDAHNLATEAFLAPAATRFRRLRYEDLVARPREELTAVVDWLGHGTVPLPLRSDHEVELSERTHAVFGNASRFRDGAVPLRRDDRWRTQMRRRDVVTVSALTGPLGSRYGYPLSR